MRFERYHVFFTDGTYFEEWAFSGEQAKLLAQAKRINKGQSFEVETVKWIGPAYV